MLKTLCSFAVCQVVTLGNLAVSWPAYSLDLNPIENLWAILKQRLQKQIGFWGTLEKKLSYFATKCPLERV